MICAFFKFGIGFSVFIGLSIDNAFGTQDKNPGDVPPRPEDVVCRAIERLAPRLASKTRLRVEYPDIDRDKMLGEFLPLEETDFWRVSRVEADRYFEVISPKGVRRYFEVGCAPGVGEII